MQRALDLLSLWAPYIWTAECIFGLLIFGRLTSWALAQRKIVRANGHRRADAVLTYLLKMALIAGGFLLLLVAVGVVALLVKHIAGPWVLWAQLLTLVTLLMAPAVLTWIGYRAFKLRSP